jgi:hypothetical protein
VEKNAKNGRFLWVFHIFTDPLIHRVCELGDNGDFFPNIQVQRNLMGYNGLFDSKSIVVDTDMKISYNDGAWFFESFARRC